MNKRPQGGCITQVPNVAVVWFSPTYICFLLVAAAMLLPAGCAAIVPPKMKVGHGPTSGPAAISHFLAQWPRPSSRLFTGTLVMAHQHIVVMGLWRFRSPWSFRLAVARKNGRLLFETRANWAGVHVLRLQPGFSKNLALAISHDISLATRSPLSLGALRVGRHQSQIVARDAWGHIIIWQFAGSAGRLRQMLVRRHTGDILTVQYGRYGLRGWPGAMAFYRPALDYAMAIQFRRIQHPYHRR